MKTLLTLFVLLFSSSLFAEDISDFEIEGISVGDSLLDHLSIEEINKFYMSYYPNSDQKFSTIEFKRKDLDIIKNYDVIQITYKKDNEDFNIYGLVGAIYFEDKILECETKKNQIVKEIESLFKNLKKYKNEISHPIDQTGKSRLYGYEFENSRGDFIQVACYDWSDDMGYSDNLRLEIVTHEFSFWREEYYNQQ